jgi:hypothetical protein
MTPEFERYDYSHLVSSPASDCDREFDAAHFDELLTDDDRNLLRRDFRISWQSETDFAQ